MRFGFRLAALVLLGATTTTQAAGSIVPQGCNAFLTVQSADCRVSHYYTCDGDLPGSRWRVVIDADGLVGRQHTDREYRWLRYVSLTTDHSVELVTPEPDPASLSTLLETGLDDYTFSRRVFLDGEVSGFWHYTGFDKLTGEETVIDGEPLLVTQFEFNKFGDGNQMLSRTYGQQYVHTGYGLFFGGAEMHISDDGAATRSAHHPVSFREPGEPGFLSTTPQFGCGAIMSMILPAPTAKES